MYLMSLMSHLLSHPCVLRQLVTWQLVCLILTLQILVSQDLLWKTRYIFFSVSVCNSRIHSVIFSFLEL